MHLFLPPARTNPSPSPSPRGSSRFLPPAPEDMHLFARAARTQPKWTFFWRFSINPALLTFILFLYKSLNSLTFFILVHFILKLIHPSNIIGSGPTGSGKTQFVSRILKSRNIDPFPTRILYLYSEWQQEYDNLLESLREITFQSGFPDKRMDLFVPSQNNLFILDDQMSKAGDTKELADLFTKGAIIEI